MKKLPILLIFAIGCRNTPPPDSTGIDVKEILKFVNIERTTRNLEPLVTDDILQFEAEDYAEAMAAMNRMQHGLKGPLMKRLSDAGYNASAAGENIAWNYRSSSAVVRGWMDSSGHRANILGNYQDTGIGVGYNIKGEPYFCQVFGRKR